MQQFEKTNTSKKGKERLDRKLNNLFYSHELGCCKVFHDKMSYEKSYKLFGKLFYWYNQC